MEDQKQPWRGIQEVLLNQADRAWLKAAKPNQIREILVDPKNIFKKSRRIRELS